MNWIFFLFELYFFSALAFKIQVCNKLNIKFFKLENVKDQVQIDKGRP